MSDNDKTIDSKNLPDDDNNDPLGIIGWEIGGKYIIRSYIGGGGFGEVYEGYNKNLTEQRLVFKFFKRVQSRDKFAKEAKILCLLDHPNISRVVDYLPDEGALAVAYIDGKDGGQILREKGPLDEETFLKVARGITSAVAYAHEKKIAHRDLKPGNIMFDSRGQIYLIDFGIAKEIGGDATKTAYQALTPLFAAPERQSGDSGYNPFLSDIYEVGITLFNFATDSLPYRNPANPDPSEWGGAASDRLSPELRHILMKATAPDPSRRYQSADEMAEECRNLKRVYGGEKKKGHGLIATLIVLAVIVVVAFFARHELIRLYNENFGKKAAVADETTDSPESLDQARNLADSIRLMDIGSEEDSLFEIASADQPAVNTPIVKTDNKTADKKPEPEKAVDTKPVKEPEKKATTPPVTKPEATDEKTVTVEPAETVKTEEPEKKPEPPARIPLKFKIIPDGDARLVVNGREGTIDTTFKVNPGEINIEVIHDDFPIYDFKTTQTASDPNPVTVDLTKQFKTTDSVSLQIALAPPSNNHMVELAFNGRRHMLTELPVLSMFKLQGWWNLESSIFSVAADNNATPHIDSLVIFPYGGGPHYATKGPSGRIKLGSSDNSGTAVVPLVIFWSEK